MAAISADAKTPGDLHGLLAHFSVEIADTPLAREEVFQLRHQVYCEERRFERGVNGQESDTYDSRSHHVLLRHRASGKAVGTVRLILPRIGGPGGDLPMESLADLPRIRSLPRHRLAEVSRFAMSKRWRASEGWHGGQLRLALVRGLVRLSAELDVHYWCALMEPTLLRLLQASSIYFHPAGELVEHRGWRQPSFVRTSEMLHRMWREKPDLWRFLTEGTTGDEMALEAELVA